MQILGNSARPQFQPQPDPIRQPQGTSAAAGPQGAQRAAAQETRPLPGAGDRYGTAGEAGAGPSGFSRLEVPDTLLRRPRRDSVEPAPGSCGGGLPYAPLGSAKPVELKEIKTGEGAFDPTKLTELPQILCPPSDPNQSWTQ